MRKNILSLNHEEARKFFLEEERYCTFDLPGYFTFEKLLKKLSKSLENSNLSDFYAQGKKPEDFERVNYDLIHNKDGNYSRRKFELIHPLLYVSLVHTITEQKNWSKIKNRFCEFQKNSAIECCSIPVVNQLKYSTDKQKQILTWREEIEQKSIGLSLDFDFLLQVDITDCYGSIYTHAIAWAIEDKEVAKKIENRNKEELVGVSIDKHIQRMKYGQTNGIPQGSILMDFIAEMVLGYIDLKLASRIKEENYKILRYRDDYRIFTDEKRSCTLIVKELSTILTDMGMKLNSQKTHESYDIIGCSIKEDKTFRRENYGWVKNIDLESNGHEIKTGHGNIQQELLLLKSFADRFPNAGMLNTQLDRIYHKINKSNIGSKANSKFEVLIAILTQIIIRNPRSYQYSIALIGKVLSYSHNDQFKTECIEKIRKKVSQKPYAEIIELRLQRLSIKHAGKVEYEGLLSKKVQDHNKEIRNSEWLKKTKRKEINEIKIINKKYIEEMDNYPDAEEVGSFNSLKY